MEWKPKEVGLGRSPIGAPRNDSKHYGCSFIKVSQPSGVSWCSSALSMEQASTSVLLLFFSYCKIQNTWQKRTACPEGFLPFHSCTDRRFLPRELRWLYGRIFISTKGMENSCPFQWYQLIPWGAKRGKGINMLGITCTAPLSSY